MTASPDDRPSGFASPPCFLHEVDPEFGVAAVDPQQATDVARWRAAERKRLIAARLAMPTDVRATYGARIATTLAEAIGNPSGAIVSAYWPFRGEPDLRDLMARLVADGGRIALPVVVEKGRPLAFRTWRPGDPLARGVWNIPIPEAGEEVVPDIVLAPVVGFDPDGYRLGYGGGFFDRTLAAARPRPRVFGVGYAAQAIATIFPQPHDIPMDRVVTEAGATNSRAGPD